MRHTSLFIVLASTALIASCSSAPDTSDAVSPINRTRVADDIYNDWIESSTETAESLGLNVTDVVDRSCIDRTVQQLNDPDAEYLTTLALGEIPPGDLTEDGWDLMDQIRDCIDFTGG